MLAIFVLHVWVFVAVLSELAPRTVTLWRFRHSQDGLGVDRLRTWIKSTGIVLVAGYESLIWADALFFGQSWLGPFPLRWHLDVAVWAVLAVGATGVAFLYWSLEKRKVRRVAEDRERAA